MWDAKISYIFYKELKENSLSVPNTKKQLSVHTETLAALIITHCLPVLKCAMIMHQLKNKF